MSFLSKLKLTAQQWAILTLVAIVGIMVVAFNIQGSILHKVKLSLMEKELDLALQKDKQNIAAKKKRLAQEKRKLKQ